MYASKPIGSSSKGASSKHLSPKTINSSENFSSLGPKDKID